MVQGGQLPVECRQLRGSEEHLQDRVPGSHLSDLLSIKIIEEEKKYDEKQTQEATSVSNVNQLVLRNLFFAKHPSFSIILAPLEIIITAKTYIIIMLPRL